MERRDFLMRSVATVALPVFTPRAASVRTLADWESRIAAKVAVMNGGDAARKRCRGVLKSTQHGEIWAPSVKSVTEIELDKTDRTGWRWEFEGALVDCKLKTTGMMIVNHFGEVVHENSDSYTHVYADPGDEIRLIYSIVIDDDSVSLWNEYQKLLRRGDGN